ncbi:MAG TPA: D-glucuronyl C5-epimerase family protein, partial [Solirubrobacteraceae bacterium]|nr:D-glucuronyl C5-epimerase family protein [Solirubrobacteraceae bacterium]
ALGPLEQDPPVGVAVRAPGGGRRYALYSFQPDLRVLNAELQAVLALRDVTKLIGSTTARRLYLRGDRALRATLASYDTGAWSRYSAGGREATAGYHRLQRDLLGRLCQRTDRGAYCALHERFARYEREAPGIDVRVPGRGRTGRAIDVRFTLSKVSEVAIRVHDDKGRTVTTRVIDKPRGTHSVRFTPSRAGRHRVRIEVRGPIGPAEVEARAVRVRDAR